MYKKQDRVLELDMTITGLVAKDFLVYVSADVQEQGAFTYQL